MGFLSLLRRSTLVATLWSVGFESHPPSIPKGLKGPAALQVKNLRGRPRPFRMERRLLRKGVCLKMEYFYYLAAGVVLLVLLTRLIYIKSITIFEYEKGLRYHRGKLVRVLEAGKYLYYAPATTIITVDTRPRITSVTGQEVITADSVSIKLSIALKYRVDDPFKAISSSEDYHNLLYTTVQAELRAVVARTGIDDLLETRLDLSRTLYKAVKEEIAPYGLELISAQIKDIMFPGELKKVFSQVIKAKKEGLATLEKVRAESAALRNLANAARMLEGNPTLAWLRLMQAVSETSGNTVVVNLSPDGGVIPLTSKTPREPENPSPSDRS